MTEPEVVSISASEFDDWKATVMFLEGEVEILCCPEDVQCKGKLQNHDEHFCPNCSVPICATCARAIFKTRPVLPPGALANDMMVYYAPKGIYEDQMTIMEMSLLHGMYIL